jgi:hypothetical protein
MRVFLSSDLVGQTYLCYLVPSLSQLFCTRLEKVNREQKLVFGVVNNITAKDAAPLPVSSCFIYEVVNPFSTNVFTLINMYRYYLKYFSVWCTANEIQGKRNLCVCAVLYLYCSLALLAIECMGV